MLYRGEIVRLPHGRGIGVVIECTADGHVLLYVGARNVFVGSPTEPLVEEYVECELMPTGQRVAQAVPRRHRPHDRRHLVG
jgi:hypothetical protein